MKIQNKRTNIYGDDVFELISDGKTYNVTLCLHEENKYREVTVSSSELQGTWIVRTQVSLQMIEQPNNLMYKALIRNYKYSLEAELNL